MANLKTFFLILLMSISLEHIQAQTALVQKLISAPIIDGEKDQIWKDIPKEQIDRILTGQLNGSSDLAGSFRLAADLENLYVLVEVIDDHHTGADGVDFFLDIGNDKNGAYGSDDFKYRLKRGSSIIEERNNQAIEGVVLGETTVDSLTRFELALPLSTLGINPETLVNEPLMGFDIQLIDEDPDETLTKLSWYSREDKAGINNAFLGIVRFDNFGPDSRANKPNFSAKRGFYDAPFELTLTSSNVDATIIYTLDGSDPRYSPNKLEGTARLSIAIDPSSIQNRGGKTPGVVVRAQVMAPSLAPSRVVTHTYLFTAAIIEQEDPGGTWPAEQYNFAWPGLNNPQNMDYAMSSNITQSDSYKDLMDDALHAIPSFSIVTNPDDLFDEHKGIYMNALERGWEKPMSVEMIDPSNNTSFQINGGLRIRGRYSRLPRNAKHSFRMLFRDTYGKSKLEYPLFGDEGTDQFKRLDFRTAQNSSWQTEESHETVTFLKEVVARDIQGEMGAPYTRSRYCHLYLNGMYWGLYQIQERAEENFAETYLGGNKSDYDIIKPEQDVPNPENDLKVRAIEGSMSSAQRLWEKALAGFDSKSDYYAIQGLDTNGVRDPGLERLLDIDNLIDYLLIGFYTGSQDGPGVIWPGLWGQVLRPNNFIGIYNRANPDGFKWIVHDFEKSMYNKDDSFPLMEQDDTWFSENIDFLNPVTIHRKLLASEDYRIHLADRIHEHMEQDGVLTPHKVRGLFDKRKAQIQQAVIAEAARWGDIISWMPANTPQNWENNVKAVFDDYLPFRTDIVKAQFEQLGVYDLLQAPIIVLNNDTIQTSSVQASDSLDIRIINPIDSIGQVYISIDGTDPRQPGGMMDTSALKSNDTTLHIGAPSAVMARVKNDTAWGPLVVLNITRSDDPGQLQLTEIHYNPWDTQMINGGDLEFIELYNPQAADVHLRGSKFTNGISYSFTDEIIKANGFLVLASNATLFEAHSGKKPTGTFDGSLKNSGEKIELEDQHGNVIIEVTYEDDFPWPVTADGGGSSLVPNNPQNADLSNPGNWRASTHIGGSPLEHDPSPGNINLRINELLANSSDSLTDAFELFNQGLNSVDLSGWYVTDDRSKPKKWQIPAGTLLAPDDYLAFDEEDFGEIFSLSSHGEELMLYAADANGALTGYSIGIKFDETDRNVSLGWHTNSQGHTEYVGQSAPSFGASNKSPKVGPVVIDRIMFHPADSTPEYLVLKNISTDTITLTSADDLSHGWKIGGVDLTLPGDIQLGPNQVIYVIQSDYQTDDFRQNYGVSFITQVINMPGALDNSGESLKLWKPGPTYDDNGTNKFEYILVEKVRYEPAGAWPSAVGNGHFLIRNDDYTYANDPLSWSSATLTTSPIITTNLTDTVPGNDVSLLNPDLTWSTAIQSISVNGVQVTDEQFTIQNDSITLSGELFPSAGEYELLFLAEGYNGALTIHEIKPLPPLGLNTIPFKIYPNPVTDHLKLEIPAAPTQLSIEILDLSGKKYVNLKLVAGVNTIDVSGLMAGIYILHVKSEERVLTQRFIKH
ncbi:MAG: lamin tail domain-containing protein [Cyclobacteriaceae bacterium]